MKTTVVTVTYGDRFDYLNKVIKAAYYENIEKLVVVSNGANKKTLEGLEVLKKDFLNLKILDLKKNTGSANGFYEGIKYAYDTGAEFIWLLDDDNLPVRGALEALKERWKSSKNSIDIIALLSYRDDRKLFKKAVEDKNPRAMLGKNNSFLGFHLFDTINKIINKNDEPRNESKSKLNYGQVSVAPYGGLFFQRSLIEVIGLPDKNYFLYGDDYDFTYRISKKNGVIFLVLNSLIKDLETSFHLKHRTSKIIDSRFLKTNSKDKIFYATRNGIWFEKNFVTNKFVYFLNLLIYIILTFCILIFNYKHLWKFVYIVKGLTAGFKK